MTRPVDHATWQLLRHILRHQQVHASKKTKDKVEFGGVRGAELRLNPSRKTKDGTFLDELVNVGLLERVGEEPKVFGTAPPTNNDEKKWAVQFLRHYRLTEKGMHAAEYGEYDEPRPLNLPVVPVNRGQ